MTQTWVETDRGHVLINAVDGHQTVCNIPRDPRVALDVADPPGTSRCATGSSR